MNVTYTGNATNGTSADNSACQWLVGAALHAQGHARNELTRGLVMFLSLCAVLFVVAAMHVRARNKHRAHAYDNAGRTKTKPRYEIGSEDDEEPAGKTVMDCPTVSEESSQLSEESPAQTDG